STETHLRVLFRVLLESSYAKHFMSHEGKCVKFIFAFFALFLLHWTTWQRALYQRAICCSNDGRSCNRSLLLHVSMIQTCFFLIQSDKRFVLFSCSLLKRISSFIFLSRETRNDFFI